MDGKKGNGGEKNFSILRVKIDKNRIYQKEVEDELRVHQRVFGPSLQQRSTFKKGLNHALINAN